MASAVCSVCVTWGPAHYKELELFLIGMLMHNNHVSTFLVSLIMHMAALVVRVQCYNTR